MTPRAHALALIAFSLAITGCGASDPASSGEPANLVAASAVDLSGVVADAMPDSLAVRVTDDRGKPVPGQLVTWRVDCSAAFACGAQLSAAERQTDASGRSRVAVTLGTHAGPTRVIAYAPVAGGAAKVNFTIDATPAAAASVTVSIPRVTLVKGSVHHLTASAVDAYGNPVAVTWSSSAPALARVDSAGVVTAVGLGVASISATAGTQKATAGVDILSSLPATIRECEVSVARLCATWTLAGSEYNAAWSDNTSSAVMTVERFGADSVIFARRDLAPFAGNSARYTGAVVNGTSVRAGAVKWFHTDGNLTGTWTADW